MSDDFHTITGDDWRRSLAAARERRAGAGERLPKPPAAVVFTFKPRFAPLVRDRVKLQTVRPRRKDGRIAEVGAPVLLRAWSGLPYRSPQIALGEARLARVSPALIREAGVWLADIPARPELFRPVDSEAFARADGFRDFAEMRAWFAEEHGPGEFFGICYAWGF